MKPPNEPANEATMMVNCSAKYSAMPAELRNLILLNLGETDLANIAVVNRQCCIDCADPSLPQTRTAIIKCNHTDGSKPKVWSPGTHPLVGVLVKIQVAASRFNDRFNHVKLMSHSGLGKINAREAKPIVRRLKLPLVTHLDMSFPKEALHWKVAEKEIHPSVGRIWTQIMPHLEEVNLSYAHVANSTLTDFANNCHNIQKIICESGILDASVTGLDLDQCRNLKELYLTNTWWAANPKEIHHIFYDTDQNRACPLAKCIENLERVSLKDCKFFDASKEQPFKIGEAFTQMSLMKFVRSAKKLQWFNSDLTKENIRILKRERPEITFVCKK